MKNSELTHQERLEKLIGKNMNSTAAKQVDWLGYWPEVDEHGIITDILDGDCIPENAILIDGFDKQGKPIIVDGDHGFEAVLVK